MRRSVLFCKVKMAFLGRRFLSSSTRLYTAISTPAPVHRIPALGTQELQSLSQKSQGSWKELTKEDKITCTCANPMFKSVFTFLINNSVQS